MVYKIVLPVDRGWLNGDTYPFRSDPDLGQLARNYLSRQRGKNVKRLFVFESPEELNSFKNILEANRRTYGNTGGVYFCSVKAYKNLIERVSVNQKFVKEIDEEDFGILTFSTSAGKKYVQAILDASTFKLRTLDFDRMGSASQKQFVELFESFEHIPESDKHPDLEIWRWGKDLYEQADHLSSSMLELFERKRFGAVLHLVLFRNVDNVTNLEEKLLELKYSLLSIKEQLRVTDVWLLSRIDIEAYDGRFLGPLSVFRDTDFTLGFTFESREALKHYYEHPMHSQEREQIYKCLNPSIQQEYLKLKKLDITLPDNRELAKEAYKYIEDKMCEYIIRHDLIDTEPVESIVRRPGVPFGTLSK